jgi:hypothetical protein
MCEALQKALKELSVCPEGKKLSWKKCRDQWNGSFYRYAEKQEEVHCLCGQHIQEVFIAVNIINGVEAIIGSTCVTRLGHAQWIKMIKDVHHQHLIKIGKRKRPKVYTYTSCSICDSIYTISEDYNHKVQCHPELLYYCKYCDNKIFKSNRQQHRNPCRNLHIYTCTSCGFNVMKKDMSIHNYKMHLGDRLIWFGDFKGVKISDYYKGAHTRSNMKYYYHWIWVEEQVQKNQRKRYIIHDRLSMFKEYVTDYARSLEYIQ